MHKSLVKRITFTLMASAAGILFFSGISPCATVVVDPNTKYQQFEGWGTSLCWWAHQEGGGSAAYLSKIADVLMDPDSGLGYSLFRYNIGGGDCPTCTDIPASRAIPGYKPTETGPYTWTADQNQRNVVAALAAKGKKIQQEVIFEAFSNSPPWWMTVSGCAGGNPSGADNLKSTYFGTFADYLTEVVKHFRDSLGITFRTLEPFNEPSAGWWKCSNNQEGCNFKNNQPLMVKLLGKSLVAKGLFPATHVSAADENSIATAISGLNVYDDSAISYMSQINTHGYKGRSTANFASIAALAASKKKILWMSESGPLSGTGGQDIAMFMAQEIIEDLKLMKVSGWIDWQSYDGGGDWETARVNPTTLALSTPRRYYMQAAFGRFIRPGSQIIESNDSNTIAALVPLTGNLVIITRNGGTASVNYTFDLSRVARLPASAHVYQYLVSAYQSLSKLPDVAIANKQFTITAPAQSIVSCAVPGVVDIVATRTTNNDIPARNFAVSSSGEHALAVWLPRQGRFDLRLFTIAGKSIFSICKLGNQGDNLIDISQFSVPSGVYFADLIQENSHRQAMVRILK